MSVSRTRVCRVRLRPAVAAGFVLLLCGCGSASSPSSTSSDAARTQFAARANSICAAALAQAKTIGVPKAQRQALPFLEKAGALLTRLVGELRAVSPPPALSGRYERFLAVAGHEAKLVEGAVRELRAHPGARMKLSLPDSHLVNAQARALGLGECARTVGGSEAG